VLSAPGRAVEIPEPEDVYGWLIGSWEMDVIHFRREDVSVRGIKGEIHFAWVLEGRAVQDSWIVPRVSERTGEFDRTRNIYSTTLRVFDPSIGAWRVTWIDPVTGRHDELVGRRYGKEIVQVGKHSDGTPIRWIFSEITADSFRWTGEALEPDGRTWTLEAEYRARRVG
jgi:hypothetical protein